MGKPSGPKLWDEFGWNDECKGLGTTALEYPEEQPETTVYISTEDHDPVDNPEHYNNGAIECIVYMKDNMTTEAFEHENRVQSARPNARRWSSTGSLLMSISLPSFRRLDSSSSAR